MQQFYYTRPRVLQKSLVSDYEDDLALVYEDTTKIITKITNDGKLTINDAIKTILKFHLINETE